MSRLPGFNKEGWRHADGASLAGADPAVFPLMNIPTDIGAAEPGFGGSFEEFAKQNVNLGHMLFNNIKKCPGVGCGKVCANTMPACNGCGTDLREVPLSQSENLFIAFIYGVKSGRFPFLVSLRYEREDVMVFDDPLAMCRQHILSVPTEVYCPDIRYLFTNPKAAIDLLIKLEACAWLGLTNKRHGKSAPFRNEACLKKDMSEEGRGYLEDGTKAGASAFRDHIMAAFNLPPSQYQLHLQYMIPPLMPNQIGALKAGHHFKKGRHFPLKYVVEGLLAFHDSGKVITNPGDLSAEDLIKQVAEVGIDYDIAWKNDMERFSKNCEKLANYSEADFRYATVGDQVLERETGQPVPDVDVKALQAQDKLHLQSYGRPYLNSKPSGKYYQYYRKPNEVIPTFSGATHIPSWVVPEGEEV